VWKAASTSSVFLTRILTAAPKGLSETIGEGEEQQPLRSEVLKTLESIKWYLWHGNVFQALRHLKFVEMDLKGAAFESQEETTELREALPS
jgi:hypothetical protein